MTTSSPHTAPARRRAVLLLAPLLLVGGTLTVDTAHASAPADGPSFEIPRRARGGNPRLAPSLHDDLAAGRPVRADARPDHVADPPAGLVTVVVETSDTAAAERAVEDGGGTVTESLPELLKAHVPADELERVANASGVRLVREPFFPQLGVQSEGVAETGAAPWHTAGWDGAGTTVAILDGGFSGYDDAIDDGELPDTVATDFSRCGGGPGSSEHGTAVAEIVHDMAPEAALRLVCIEDDVDYVSALGTMAANGVDIVNGSFGFTLTGRGDGSGTSSTVAGATANLRAQGILYVASAGNYGQHHYHTNAVGDPAFGDDNDDFVNISPGDSFLFAVGGFGEVGISVSWDAWPTTRQDFDIYVGNDLCGLVGASTLDQANGPLPPREFLTFQSCSASPQTFELIVNRFSGAATPRLDIYFDGDVGEIEHISASSLVEPATSPAALAVGAHCVINGVRQPYSSQGPSIDGRGKPDISGPDATSSSVYGPIDGCDGGFTGTSASAPHVAGAAAVLLGTSPGLDVAELQQLLEDRALDTGVAGNDNQYGAGRVRLGTAGDAAVPVAQPYTSTGPVRLLDSRPGPLGASEGAFGGAGRTTPIGAASSLRLQVAGIAGVPANATAVVLNVTGVSPTKAGYLTVYPAGQRPTVSNLNFAAKQTIGVNVTATVAPDDRITIYNSAGSTHVVVDLAGWYGPTGTGGNPATARFNALPAPLRALNTQPSQTGYAEGPFGPGGARTPLGPGQSIPLQVAGLGGVAADATAVIINVAVVTPSSTGYLTLYPDGATKPVASSINFGRLHTLANLAVIPVGPGGKIRIHNAQGTTHVVIDVVGAFRPGTGAGYVALDPPTRQLNTLTGTGLRKSALGANATHKLRVARYDGVPADALAVSMGVAVVTPTTTGYLTVYPGTQPRPFASNINFIKGSVLANAVVAALGTDGTVAFTNSAGSTNVAADLAGYFIDPANQPVPLDEPPL